MTRENETVFNISGDWILMLMKLRACLFWNILATFLFIA
jgi:hypothetical protein